MYNHKCIWRFTVWDKNREIILGSINNKKRHKDKNGMGTMLWWVGHILENVVWTSMKTKHVSETIMTDKHDTKILLLLFIFKFIFIVILLL
jgi:hypothetical protein